MAEGKTNGFPIFFPAARKQKLKLGHFVDEVGLELHHYCRNLDLCSRIVMQRLRALFVHGRGKTNGFPIYCHAARMHKSKLEHYVDKAGLELRPHYGKILSEK